MSTLADPTPFQEIEHTADLAMRATGADLGVLLRHMALGMFSLMRFTGAHGDAVAHTLTLRASDRESLLVDWLNELLYLCERDGYGHYVEIELTQVSDDQLCACVAGWRSSTCERAIKAATFSGLQIRCQREGLIEATVTFDV